MSRVNALLASFKQGQKKALHVQAEARQEREDKLAKAAAGGGAGRGRGGRAGGGRGRGGKAASAQSGEASASVASAAGAGAASDWRQRQAQQAMPLGAKLKSIVDFLRTAAEPQRPQAIAAATGYDPQADRKLAEALAVNSKVVARDDGLYAYRPEVANVHSKQEVLEYMRRRERQSEGYAALGELQDAYPGVQRDLEELKKEGLLLSLPAADVTRKEVYYPVDQRIKLRELWLSIGEQLPDEEDELQEALQQIGLKPAPRQVLEKREAREKKRKARKVRRLTKVTNMHLKHLLDGDAPSNIETA
ncbi:hypothetical protein CHLNCDRAFT_144778 [Chlorella variabilis]|uniref:TFA2 Winged helix domain-containing protein n=1 Tax=Chlorella variabilis TaxID=554065 RepID=E1ZD01_CHLVA|nr:hypothetical protein CHLNCDRAFT_144778 [Chlorella variabilis]EFN56136.1 hypothetical protein CHLNCDRAFT_144778 [Chlorella variabilis]|eukprot:XP_005848238.1 hypothetical protein CHLNCDRAFT_144778 [Chlorella variabilis]